MFKFGFAAAVLAVFAVPAIAQETPAHPEYPVQWSPDDDLDCATYFAILGGQESEEDTKRGLIAFSFFLLGRYEAETEGDVWGALAQRSISMIGVDIIGEEWVALELKCLPRLIELKEGTASLEEKYKQLKTQSAEVQQESE